MKHLCESSFESTNPRSGAQSAAGLQGKDSPQRTIPFAGTRTPVLLYPILRSIHKLHIWMSKGLAEANHRLKGVEFQGPWEFSRIVRVSDSRMRILRLRVDRLGVFSEFCSHEENT